MVGWRHVWPRWRAPREHHPPRETVVGGPLAASAAPATAALAIVAARATQVRTSAP